MAETVADTNDRRCAVAPWWTDFDPLFGSLADFDAVVAPAHARELRVLVDLVPNHTSHRHPWFRAALSVLASRRSSVVVVCNAGDDRARVAVGTEARLAHHTGGATVGDGWVEVASDHAAVVVEEAGR